MKYSVIPYMTLNVLIETKLPKQHSKGLQLAFYIHTEMTTGSIFLFFPVSISQN